MRLSDFQYSISDKLIAQYPSEKRDQSRLLVLNRTERKIHDCQFSDIVQFLSPKDALVINETKVFPARLRGRKEKTNANIEVFLIRELTDSHWEVLVKPARRVRIGNTIHFSDNVACEVVDNTISGGRVIRLTNSEDILKVAEQFGEPPLPPYIKRSIDPNDKDRYQTVYARVSGAVAAPTAGLHFTPELLSRIREIGVSIVPIVLHIGLGTFKPVESEDISRHLMHSEYYEISETTALTINKIIADGGRIFAVGTTSTRTLETAANSSGVVNAEFGWTDKFIYPPYNFKIVDALITNFHLPRSTLLMLVSAFSDRDFIIEAYEHAIRNNYRFYSYGDAMLII